VVRYFVSVLKSNIFLLMVFFLLTTGGVWVNKDKITKSKNPEFCIKKIVFDGNDRVSDILLLKASGLRYKSNIFAVSLDEVKRKLENVAWVKSVVVRRKLLDTIYVRIVERVPIAILQSQHKLYLIDANGTILENDGIGDFNNLPIVIGEGAEKEADKLLACLDKFPKIRKQLVFAVRVGKRRWNIKINRGITVKLPEKGLMYALGILSEISDANSFFNDDISVIDLRMLDRVVVTKK